MSRAMPTRVVVAEDDPSVRRALDAFLRSLGLDVQSVGSGVEALQHLDGADVLITDVKMPKMDGMELLSEAKRRNPDLAVIVLTGHASVPLAVEAMRMGAANFLTKPFELDELQEALASAGAVNPSPPKSPAPPTAIDAIIGESPAITGIRVLLERLAHSDANILIGGESGTGKGVAADAIHKASRRRDKRFVSINCGAIPENLFESELFGHRKGAFTGATSDRIGYVAEADGGTLFLDEVGELPMSLQPKLLHLLQDREYAPVGSTRVERADIRVIAATNRDLESMSQEGLFREDLYWRLNVLSIDLPPLREREEDVILLANRFLELAAAAEGRHVSSLDEEAAGCLRRYTWPGNVRELQHCITRAVVLASGSTITLADLPPRVRSSFGRGAAAGAPTVTGGAASVLPDEGMTLREHVERVERALIEQALERTGGNKTRAAELLGMNRTTLVEKLKRWS